MAETVNQEIEDGYVDNAVDTQQFAEGLVLTLVALLNRHDSEMAAALLEALDNVPAEQFTVDRLDRALGQVRAINQAAYEQVRLELEQQLAEFAKFESDWQYELLVGIIPPPAQSLYPIAKINATTAYATATTTPIQGRTIAEWMAAAVVDRLNRIRNAVRQRVVDGESPASIVSAIRGTKAAKYSDGLLQKSRQDLGALISTFVTHIGTVTRDMFSDANDGLIKAELWVSVLDSRTSGWCIERSRKLYTPETHKPIGHKVPWLSGPGSIHFKCRSTSTLIIKSWRELNIPSNLLTDEQKAAMDGKAADEQSYSEWLAKQSPARQDQILGKERGKLYRNGDLSLARLFNVNGQLATIEQLRARLRG